MHYCLPVGQQLNHVSWVQVSSVTSLCTCLYASLVKIWLSLSMHCTLWFYLLYINNVVVVSCRKRKLEDSRMLPWRSRYSSFTLVLFIAVLVRFFVAIWCCDGLFARTELCALVSFVVCLSLVVRTSAAGEDGDRGIEETGNGCHGDGMSDWLAVVGCMSLMHGTSATYVTTLFVCCAVFDAKRLYIFLCCLLLCNEDFIHFCTTLSY